MAFIPSVSRLGHLPLVDRIAPTDAEPRHRQTRTARYPRRAHKTGVMKRVLESTWNPVAVGAEEQVTKYTSDSIFSAFERPALKGKEEIESASQARDMKEKQLHGAYEGVSLGKNGGDKWICGTSGYESIVISSKGFDGSTVPDARDRTMGPRCRMLGSDVDFFASEGRGLLVLPVVLAQTRADVSEQRPSRLGKVDTTHVLVRRRVQHGGWYLVRGVLIRRPGQLGT